MQYMQYCFVVIIEWLIMYNTINKYHYNKTWAIDIVHHVVPKRLPPLQSYTNLPQSELL